VIDEGVGLDRGVVADADVRLLAVVAVEVLRAVRDPLDDCAAVVAGTAVREIEQLSSYEWLSFALFASRAQQVSPLSRYLSQ
jgi:hypothetical protein